MACVPQCVVAGPVNTNVIFEYVTSESPVISEPCTDGLAVGRQLFTAHTSVNV
jgi:hypothetical protein